MGGKNQGHRLPQENSMKCHVRLIERVKIMYKRNCHPIQNLYSTLIPAKLYTGITLSVRASINPSVCPSVRPYVCPSVHPSVCLSVRPSIRLSVRPSVCAVLSRAFLYNVFDRSCSKYTYSLSLWFNAFVICSGYSIINEFMHFLAHILHFRGN